MPCKVLIIIPCYNEEASLPLVLNELKGFAPPHNFKIDILVVNDCSTDNTASIARKNQALLLDLTCNLGIGGAMQTGFKYAVKNGYDVAIQLDGDGQHPPQELIKLLNAYSNDETDVIIGSRFLDREGFQSSFMRRAGISYFYRLNKLLTGNPVYDSTSGFRLLGRKALAIAVKNYPDDYPEPESLVIFGKCKLKIIETPVIMQSRTSGTSSIQHSASIYYIVKVTIAMFFSYIRKTKY
jgi:glycosyltransferase involved in cell wall biosynthesis